MWLKILFCSSAHIEVYWSTFYHTGIKSWLAGANGPWTNRVHVIFFNKYLQRSISRNNYMASSRPEQHATSVLCKMHLNGTDCCTLYNSSPVELPQQESGDVCTWKWQLNVCVHLCVLLVGSESSFTDGEECPQVREDWVKDMKQGWPGSQRKTTEEQRNCS